MIIILPSETYTRKAQRILTAKGYTCEVIRITNPGDGCTFGLKTADRQAEIQSLLYQTGIPVRGFRNERDGT